MGPRFKALNCLVALCLVVSVSATPLPVAVVEPSPTPVILAISLCTPFVVLATLKFSYVRHRRAQTIHCHNLTSTKDTTKATRLLGLGFDSRLLYPTTHRKLNFSLNTAALTGYLVGAFGSPDWETRMRVRVDTATRKCRPPSSFLQSPSPSTASVRFSSFNDSSKRSRTTTGGARTSMSASRFSSSRSRSVSVSYLEMGSPEGHAGAGITHCATVHPSSPACTDGHTPPMPSLPAEAHRKKSGSVASRRHASTSSVSPTLMQMMEPVIASWRQDQHSSSSSSNSSQSRSPILTPTFESPVTTPHAPPLPTSGSGSTARFTVNVITRATRKRSMAASVHNVPLPVPAAAYSPDMSYKNSISMPIIKSPLSPRAMNVDATKSPTGSGEKTPRPLNSKAFVSLSPEIAGVTSPGLGADWELGDLLRNGHLDIDAVSDALGLGFPTTPNPNSPSLSSGTSSASDSGGNTSTPDSWTARHSAGEQLEISAASLIRKNGGPLCAIPEETDDIDALGVHLRRPLSSLVERWGRAVARDSGGVVRESVSSSILNVDMSLLGLDISVITPTRESPPGESTGIWEEGKSWKEGGVSRDSIGLAC